MLSCCREFFVDTEGESRVYDVTGEVSAIVAQEGLQEGIATVFAPGATASVTTIEFEPGAVEDLREALERTVPRSGRYAHNARWGDGNGFSHVRAALLGPGLTVPVSGGELQLGTWQQIVVVDHDNRPRRRKLVVQLMGTS
ncbi:MAG: YjbQ family protein [Deltaproteobacteria bacterium]|nr:MAG: YjbQ family protein [Deltaproteobacteria bacterium]